MSMKAHAVFKSLVTVGDDEKILLDHGSLRELLDREETKRQKFEYVKEVQVKKDKQKLEQRKKCRSNLITF